MTDGSAPTKLCLLNHCDGAVWLVLCLTELIHQKGDIALCGHPYGFIGGASGKISDSTVVFFGDIRKHGDFERISEFLHLHGCDFECTDKGSLRDIGGILPIIEEV